MTYTSEVLADSPSGYWRLGEPSGTSAADSSGGSNTGTYVNAPTLGVTGVIATDPTDTAVTFNGTDEYVTVADHATLDLGDVFTMEIWAKRGITTGQHRFIDKGAGGYSMMISATDQLRLDKAETTVIVSSTIGINETTNWHHYVATKNGGTVKLYIDGVDVTGSVTAATCVNTTSALRIGRKSDTSVDFFNGTLDEAAVYPTALSAARVLVHYQAGIAALVTGHVDITVATSLDAAGRVTILGAADTTVLVDLAAAGIQIDRPLILTPVDPGTLTLDSNSTETVLQAGNDLPYQVGVEFLGPTIAGPIEPEGYIPVLTPKPAGVLTGEPT